MYVTPAQSASWIRKRLLRIEFLGSGAEDCGYTRIGLRMYFKEVVPELLLLDLRFELMIEVPEVVHETGKMRIGYRCPAFVVTDALTVCSSPPSCRLELRPAQRISEDEDCHHTTFRTLADEAAQYARRDGTPRDWRNNVVRLRFYHPARRAKKQRTVRNPDYDPLQTVHVSTVWDSVPRALQKEDAQTLEEFLEDADRAFDDAFEECAAGELLTAPRDLSPTAN